MPRVDFVFFDAGGGHRSAATALKSVIDEQRRDWQLRLLNLQEVLDSMDIFRKLTGIRMQDVYNRMLANGWTLGSEYLIPVMHALIRLYHPSQVRMLGEFWSTDTPDAVVSVVPNFNRALLQGYRRVSAHGPFVTILTDMADWPPHFWIEKQDQFFICGTERAAEQARALGHPDDHIFRTSGMILRPAFYQRFSHDRAAELRKLGLDPHRKTGIVLFGGQGSPEMSTIARELRPFGRGLQLILICGRNEKLAAELRAMAPRSAMPMHIVGFTQEIPYLMSLGDFLIGKPGPGSISEALALHLPVIVQCNAWTLPQERFNAEWVLEKDVGLVVRSFREIASAVERMLEPDRFARMRANAAAMNNRAIYEIPEILETIFARCGISSHSPRSRELC